MFQSIVVFLMGAGIYGTIELLYRGWTHWSMLLAGGICICLMFRIANCPVFSPMQKWILSAAVITTVEFVSGIFLNLLLGWQIWDYSAHTGNLLGQICPTYCLMWLGISIPGIWFCKQLSRFLAQ